jgi:hypothetical protein
MIPAPGDINKDPTVWQMGQDHQLEQYVFKAIVIFSDKTVAYQG